MHSNTFQFCCRFLSQKLSEGVDLKSAVQMLSKNYPQFQPNSALNNPIYKLIIAENNPHKQQEMLSLYGVLKFDNDIATLTKLTNIRNYLFLISFVFVIMSAICKVFVIPVFEDIFALMETPEVALLHNFNFYWTISFLLLVITSSITLAFSSIINNIYSKLLSFRANFLTSLIVSKKIINQTHRITALIYAPFNNKINTFSEEKIDFINLLRDDNLNVAEEMQLSLDIEYQTLNKLVNKRITKLLFLLTVIVVSAIFNFIYSLYAPIFYIGNIQ